MDRGTLRNAKRIGTDLRQKEKRERLSCLQQSLKRHALWVDLILQREPDASISPGALVAG